MSSNNKRRAMGRPAAGFTLVELMVVIVLIGLLAGAATLATRSYLLAGKQGVANMEISRIGQALDTFYAAYDRYPTSDEGLEVPYRAARLADAAQRVAFVDEQARAHARRFGRAAELVCDLDKNVLFVEAGQAAAPESLRLAIPSGVRLERVRTVAADKNLGQARIAIGSDGQGPSYAVWLSGPGGAEKGLFFAGLTGQVVHLEKPTDEEPLFRLLSSPGADAR